MRNYTSESAGSNPIYMHFTIARVTHPQFSLAITFTSLKKLEMIFKLTWSHHTNDPVVHVSIHSTNSHHSDQQIRAFSHSLKPIRTAINQINFWMCAELGAWSKNVLDWLLWVWTVCMLSLSRSVNAWNNFSDLLHVWSSFAQNLSVIRLII